MSAPGPPRGVSGGLGSGGLRSGVIGEADVLEVYQGGRRIMHLDPGALITQQAREAADRLGVRLAEGPPPQSVHPATDGPTTLRRTLYRRSPRWIAPGQRLGISPTKFRRLVVVGAGGVGANTAHLAHTAGLADEIVLVDVLPGAAEATALDLAHSSGITRSSTLVEGGTDLSLITGADVVVITAGRPRSPGMSRSDLRTTNSRVVVRIAETIRELAPGAVAVVVTNPLDEMTTDVLTTTGFAREQVIGMAGTLDSARFRRALANEARVDPADVVAMTLGSHGDEMVPIVSMATIRGRPLRDTLSTEQIDRCVSETITGGAQVVKLRRTGSATLAPAHATVEVLDAMRGATAGAIPVSVRLDGEYGINEVVLGVPCLLGASGVVEIVELALSNDEHEALKRAAAAISARMEG